MATAQTAAKPFEPKPAPLATPPAPPDGHRAQKMRAAQTKKVNVGSMKPVGHFSDPQQVMLSSEWDFEDVLKPEAWTFIAPQLQANKAASVMQDRLGTMFHVYTADHAFYAILYVKGLRRNAQGQADALDVTCIGPLYDAETDRCYPVDVKTGGRWRGRG